MLGRFRVERDGVPITDWRRQSAAGVLKRLLLADQHRLGREHLAQQLFPTARPKTARDMLTTAIHALRVALEPNRACAGPSRYLVQEGETLELRLRSTDWVDLTAFAAPPCVCFGNSGRNILRGPGFVNLDFGVSRNFAVGERFRIEFRAESFNLANHPNFGIPSMAIGNQMAGIITTVVNPERQNQLAMKFRF